MASKIASRIRGMAPRLCVGCGSQIHDQYILRVAPNLEWHAACLKCCACQKFLDEKCTCFVRDGKIFCKEDYLRLFGTKCEKCGRSFGKNDFVMRAKNKIFHLECFRCISCGKQLVPGDEFALRSDGLYCKEDHQFSVADHEDHQDVGGGGGGGGHGGGGSGPAIITSTTASTTNTASMPGGPPGGREQQTVVIKREENNNNNNGSSSNQGNSINGDMEDDNHLGQDDDFDDDDDDDTKSDLADHKTDGLSSEHGSDTSSSGHHHRRHLHDLHGAAGHGQHQQQRRSRAGRVRTVLTEKQLQLLKSCYSANPRPDALMKEQLVEMTGLSPRVVRVWFQNKRCKDKKKMQMKQSKEVRKLGYAGMQGLPMMASSPIRHDHLHQGGGGLAHSGLNPIDVHAYEPPWKALCDFALHSDLDRVHAPHPAAAAAPPPPHYQNLVNQMHGYDYPVRPEDSGLVYGAPLSSMEFMDEESMVDADSAAAGYTLTSLDNMPNHPPEA